LSQKLSSVSPSHPQNKASSSFFPPWTSLQRLSPHALFFHKTISEDLRKKTKKKMKRNAVLLADPKKTKMKKEGFCEIEGKMTLLS